MQSDTMFNVQACDDNMHNGIMRSNTTLMFIDVQAHDINMYFLHSEI